MKKVLGIILAILGVLAFLSFLVLCGMGTGASFGEALLAVLILLSIPAVIFGFIWLVAWLLDYEEV